MYSTKAQLLATLLFHTALYTAPASAIAIPASADQAGTPTVPPPEQLPQLEFTTPPGAVDPVVFAFNRPYYTYPDTGEGETLAVIVLNAEDRSGGAGAGAGKEEHYGLARFDDPVTFEQAYFTRGPASAEYETECRFYRTIGGGPGVDLDVPADDPLKGYVEEAVGVSVELSPPLEKEEVVGGEDMAGVACRAVSA